MTFNTSSATAQAGEATFGLAIIARNAEGTLAEQLAHIIPFVDYVALVDTGSDDRTKEIAEEYNVKVIDAAATSLESTLRICRQEAPCDWLGVVKDVVPLSDISSRRIRTWLQTLPSNNDEALYEIEPTQSSASPGKGTKIRFERMAHFKQPNIRLSQQPSTSIAPRTLEVDVIILSYAKTRAHYDMTRNCIRSLRRSEREITFNIVVVETGTPEELKQWAPKPWFDKHTKVIFPRRPFNYNLFLQMGFQHFNKSGARALLIANNDVIFESKACTHMLDGLTQFHSVSPWCPGHHDQYFAGAKAYYEGWRTSLEVCGWAIMCRRELIEELSFEKLFPDDFEFWCQDNYYAHQLETAGKRHALVTTARVRHLFEQSHGLIHPSRYKDITLGAREVLRRKLSGEVAAHEVLLTVAVPSLPSRTANELPYIFAKLARQAEDKPVEVLAFIDNKRRTLGSKRNALVNMAKGRYIVFVDDDDDVAGNYVDTLLETIRKGPGVDCIALNANVNHVGGPTKPCRYGVEYQDIELADSYYRRPNHVCCFRKDLVAAFPREDLTWGEDTKWAGKINRHVRTQLRIDDVLYTYNCDPSRSESLPTERGVASTSRQCQGNDASTSEDQIARLDKSRDPVLTIAVLSVTSRVRQFLPAIIAKLDRQATGKPVEVLGLLDNKRSSIGEKRNLAHSLARGQFISFVDDDDDVADTYVDALLEAIGDQRDADCVVFDSVVSLNGGRTIRCHYGIEYEDEDRSDAFYRKPNHICCFRREIARKVPFENTNWHEDFQWAEAVQPHIHRQSRIPDALYHYRYSSLTSESLAPKSKCVNTPTGSLPVPEKSHQPLIRDHASVQNAREGQLPIYGFIHVAMINHWREIVSEQLLKIRACGLHERLEKIFVGLVGPNASHFDFDDDKIQVIYHSKHIEEGEIGTLEALARFCRTNQCLVFYIHTKGVAHVSHCTRDWRHLMEHFVITKHTDCIRQLVDHDVCGVNWNTRSVFPHFSGNFWWARSDYIETLEAIRSLPRTSKLGHSDCHLCERWIGNRPNVRVACLHLSHVNHYEERYPRRCYARLQEVTWDCALDKPSEWRGFENCHWALQRVPRQGASNGAILEVV